MKIPEKTPDFKEIMANCHIPELAFKVKDVIRKANTEYMYWDDLKYQPMPEDIRPEEAWAVLKWSRIIQTRLIPLNDKQGQAFSYWLPESVLKEIHFIDKQAAGKILADDPSVQSEEKRRYMIGSLFDEAIASSQIEGAVTTRAAAREMLRERRKPRDRSEQMICNNYLSMQIIKKHASDPLSLDLMNKIHTQMTENTLDDTSWAGRFRAPADDEIHILDNDGQTVLHVPPKAGDVPALMQSLCDYANSKDEDEFIHPAIKGILLHFWIAYVHPYMDGNGRTARALFYWYMLRHDYRLFEYLSISAAILSARSQYYRSFLYSEIDANDATYFIFYNLQAIHKAIEKLGSYITGKQKEKKHAYRFAVNYPSLNLRQRALLVSALENPHDVFTIEVHSNVHGITYQTARTDLLSLKDMGLLEMRKEGKKFVFTPVADIAEKLECSS